jgi:hypothetical protein
MLPLLLFAVSFPPAQQASLQCANSAVAETQPVSGPGGAVAVLRISSADDHSKNTHLCSAAYQLLVTAGGGEPRAVDLLTSDDDYDRKLSVELSGFSEDGQRVLGILTEGAKRPLTMVFDYHLDDGTVELLDLREKFAGLLGESCAGKFRVTSIAESGDVVVELTARKPCAGSGRWALNSSGKKARKLLPGTQVTNLYPSRQ